MFDILPILIKTKFEKINESFKAKDIKAGIIYSNTKNPLDKILFTIENDCAKDVFSNKLYPLNDNGEYFVSDIVSLSEPIKYFFKKDILNLAEMYLVYKRFISSDQFINRNLDYFGMGKSEIGYKGKLEIIKQPMYQPNLNYKTYYGLMKIINCKNEIKKYETDHEKRK